MMEPLEMIKGIRLTFVGPDCTLRIKLASSVIFYLKFRTLVAYKNIYISTLHPNLRAKQESRINQEYSLVILSPEFWRLLQRNFLPIAFTGKHFTEIRGQKLEFDEIRFSKITGKEKI